MKHEPSSDLLQFLRSKNILPNGYFSLEEPDGTYTFYLSLIHICRRRRRDRVDNILSERARGHAGEHHREHQNHTHDATQSVGCVFHAFFLLLECVLIVHLGREMYLTYSV